MLVNVFLNLKYFQFVVIWRIFFHYKKSMFFQSNLHTHQCDEMLFYQKDWSVFKQNILLEQNILLKHFLYFRTLNSENIMEFVLGGHIVNLQNKL
jgi:hypothetical protein